MYHLISNFRSLKRAARYCFSTRQKQRARIAARSQIDLVITCDRSAGIDQLGQFEDREEHTYRDAADRYTEEHD